MASTRVKADLIANDSARKEAYKKRKKSLLKKVEEISTLCGVDACAIVCSPYDPQPEVWPSPWEVENMISKFRTMPELDKNRKMLDQESFLKQRILKTQDQLKKQEKANKEKAMTNFMFQCLAAGKIVDDNMSMGDLEELCWFIDNNLKDIDRRIETLDTNFQIIAPSQVHVAAPSQVHVATHVPALPQPMANNDENALMGDAHRLSLNSMDLINDVSVDGEIPFGYVNLPLGDYLPNPLP